MIAATLELSAFGSRSYAFASWLFLRFLGVIYLCAFLSLAPQLKGLVGRRGIIPAADFLAARRRFGPRRFWRIPTLLWLNSSDRFMQGLCWTGVLAAVLLAIGFAPVPMLLLLWVSYLSVFSVGRVFLGYQWDILLLEVGFLGILLAPFGWLPGVAATAPSPILVWLFWWLLFRLMWSSGMVKLRSGDVHWRRLTALAYHYETQPLPTPVSWHAHHLPAWFHRVSTAVMFAIELGAPWLIFAPPPLPYIAAALFFSLMVLIQLTGNYCFFNLLAIALSLFLLDDEAWATAFRFLGLDTGLILPAINFRQQFVWVHIGFALLLLALALPPLARLLRWEPRWPRPIERLFDFFEPFHLVNSYGLFAVMTTERPEIIIEGSQDGTTWRPYVFKWKPGDPRRAPRFVAPHQPRLDWQLWFAALGFAGANPWFLRFLIRLQEGSPEVLSLLKNNPFPSAPPLYLRAVMYRYRFTSRHQRRREGTWWTREERGLYCPILEKGTAVVED